VVDEQWYLAIRGQQQGPLAASAIAEQVRAGQVGRDAYVFRAGMPEWRPIAQTPEFASLFGAATPPPPPGAGAAADEIDYEIGGNEMQYVEVTLDPGEACVAEAGAFFYMDPDVEVNTIFGDGSAKSQGADFLGKLLSAGKRLLTGESLFMTVFSNPSSARRRVAFAAPYPGKIVAMDLKATGGTLLCQKDAFLCAARGVAVGIAFQRRLGAGLFGGEGFILEKLEGDGLAFVHACGTICERSLAAGETLRVDTGCLVAFEESVGYDIQMVKGIKTFLFGGEGLFYATVTGPGRVWMQTLPFGRLASRVIAASGITRGGRREEGSILGPLGNLLDGDG